MAIREEIKGQIKSAFQKIFESVELPDFSMEVPENPEHGDYATNIAMLSAKILKKKPVEIAEILAAEFMKENQEILAIASFPGFINFRLSGTRICEELQSSAKVSFAFPQWQGKKVILEFTDLNPFKEFHIGHLYTNTIGEALSRLLEVSGAVVRRATYQGDVGMHVAKAIWGMLEKLKSEHIEFKDLESRPLRDRLQFMGSAYAFGAEAYDKDPSAKEEIKVLNKKIFLFEDDVKEIYAKGRSWSLEHFESIYKRLGTKFDFYYFEREVASIGQSLVEENLWNGIFEKSEGAIVFPGEKYGLHRRVFINSEGLPTYEAKELGLAPTKYKDFPYDLSLIITGNDIVDYFKVLFAALNQLYPDLGAKTRHIAHGMVRLPHGKMGSRTGNVIRGEDLLNEVKGRVLERMKATEFLDEEREKIAEQVALGAVKYSLLRVGIGKDIAFDIDTSLSIEGDSGPYLQYTYARFKSILRKNESVLDAPEASSMSELERRLAVVLLRFPDAIEDAARSFSPNTLATYLHNLAMLANEFYHTHPVAQEPDGSKKALRLTLSNLLVDTLFRGLFLLGIEAPEKM